MRSRGAGLWWTALALALAGCGGADLFSSQSSNRGLDGGLGGNFSGFGASGTGANPRTASAAAGRGTYPMIETGFELPDVKGNPFDFAENDVQVTITTPDARTVKAPAFYDGENGWKVRYTPDVSGKHTFSGVSLNGRPVTPEKMEKREIDVSGAPQPGFIRIDPRDKTRFAFDNGNSFLPIGHNLAWGSGRQGDLAGALEKMGRAGINWSRIWMNHWDGKNLDWTPDGKGEPGTLNLAAAKRWDEIVQAAEKAGVHFQMVLQHHGQYSTRTDPNWDINPWNKKNGGFLSTPDEFFTDPRAIALTKAKYRYIIARWGYSPAIMAWELFNEVEYTNSIANKHADEVIAWHNGMAKFLREQDPYKHLITTSSDVRLAGLWENMDYYQAHMYTADPLVAASLDARELDKPLFYGEFGPSGVPQEAQKEFYRRALWAGLAGGSGIPPQFWHWEAFEKNDWYDLFRGAGDFIRASGIASRRGLLPAAASVETPGRGPLVFSPGLGWAASKTTELIVPPSGAVEGLSKLPAYIQGSANREMFPGVTLKVSYPQDGTFKVVVDKAAKAGAKLVITLDGAPAAEKDFPAGTKDSEEDVTVEIRVPAGSHDLKVENGGPDWFAVKQYVLSPYAPTLQAIGRSGKEYAAVWLLNRDDKPGAGKLSLSGLQAGDYKATWWDPATSKPVNEAAVKVEGTAALTLTTPEVKTDLALYVVKSGEKAAGKKKEEKAAPAKASSASGKPAAVPARGAPSF